MSSSIKRNTTAQLNPFKEEATSTKKNKKKNDVVWIGIKIIKALLLEDKRITLGFCFISCLLLAQFFLMRVFYVSFFLGKHKAIHNNKNMYDDKFNTPPVVVGSLNDLLQSMNMNHEDDGMTTTTEDDSSSSSVSDTSLSDSSSLVKNDNNNELKIWSKEEILELSFTVPVDYSVFDNCFDPYSSSSNNATNNDNDNNNMTPCSYFRPSQFLVMEEIEEYLSSPETMKMREKTARPNMWAWAREMNNWPHNMDGHGPPLLPDPKTVNRTSLNEIESLTYFGCPKCGSRTIFSLVLDHLVDPKVDMPRFGFISPEYAKQFELLQQQEQKEQKEEESGKTITLRKKRENVAFAIFRDIVSRFISGLYQLHSMIGTKRCANCEEHLYKCLLDDKLDLPRTEYEQEKLSQVIDCYVNVVKENGFFDEHLVPMTWYFTQHFHGFNDIEIAMFPMEHLNFLTKYGFGVEKDLHENSRFDEKPNKKNQQNTVARNNFNNKKNQPLQQNPNKAHRRLQHQRHQNPPKKREEETEEDKKKKTVENMMNVLKHLTNPLMLKRETRKRICDLYAADVVLIRSIHFPLQSCDFSF